MQEFELKIHSYIHSSPAAQFEINMEGNEGEDELWKAAFDGYKERVQKLVHRGANVEQKGGLWESTPLYTAALKGHFEIVQFLVLKGANINACSDFGDSPIAVASRNGHLNVVELLLQNGADITIRKGVNINNFMTIVKLEFNPSPI